MSFKVRAWMMSLVLFVTLFLVLLSGFAQRGGQPPQSPRAAAAIDLGGTWVSVVTEDWKYRMVTPRKGDLLSIPLNAEGRRVANAWDPAKDEAAGEQCKGYGAVGGMRLPGQIRFSWQDDSTLKLELEAGNQTRQFRFGSAQPATGDPTWQGQSTADWEYALTGRGGPRMGNLKVVTTRMRPGYGRKNGVAYGPNANLTEYFHIMTLPDNSQWLTVISELRDPQHYTEPWVVSSHFKKVAANSPWTPEPCSVR
jgi:hypothetical protein